MVLKESQELIAEHLLCIFRAIFASSTYSGRWKEWLTAVLHKPGKPDYGLAKAYHPIALLNTIAKLPTSMIAENLTYLCEKYKLLPATHFSRCLGRTTTDPLHLLTYRIHHAWCNNRVASVLFLYIEGVFPNTLTDCLLHNMRR